MSDDIRVRLGDDRDIDECLRVLSTAYDRPFTREWFSWKHRDCPWGPSRMYIAEDDGGVLGVVFGLDWPYRRRAADGSITHIDGARFVDGATLPPARGRRVLGILVRDELLEWDPASHQGVLLATATPAAQRSHARNGASTLEPITSSLGIPRSLRPAALLDGDSILDSHVESAPGVTGERLSTAWTPATLRWRIDARSGRDYRVAALASSDAPNGIVYRVARQRGLRALYPVITWGTVAEQRRLVGAVALSVRAPVVHAPVGAAVAEPLTRPFRSSGTSVMCVWDRRELNEASGPPATIGSSWSLSMADLEGLI